MTISASPAPAGRWTGTATPVDVSLCAHAITSTDGSDCGFGAPPGSDLMMMGSPTKGFLTTHEANFALCGGQAREIVLAREGATVSMPLSWAQVRGDLDPRRYTVRSVPALLAKTKAWQDYDAAASSIKAAIGKLAAKA